MVKKLYDKDIKLYLDIVKELNINYKLTLLRYNEFYRLKNYSEITYIQYKMKKRKELRSIVNRLSKRLNILTLDKFSHEKISFF